MAGKITKPTVPNRNGHSVETPPTHDGNSHATPPEPAAPTHAKAPKPAAPPPTDAKPPETATSPPKDANAPEAATRPPTQAKPTAPPPMNAKPPETAAPPSASQRGLAFMQLVQELQRLGMGQSSLAPGPKDRRFQDPTWTSNPLYKGWLQTYLAWSRWLDASVAETGLPRRDQKRLTFMLDQYRDALAPTNFFWGNPAAIKRFVETGGQSAVRGVKNYVNDLVHNGGMPATVDRKPFTVGENLAVTPGAVVHRTDRFELIQYAPQTETVYSRPLLAIPPQVNRYYAVDLAPGRSLFEHLVKHGQQLFTIVWRNPSAEHRDWGFDAYMQSILEAIDVVRDITGAEDLNTLGACAGGMTLAMLMSHLAACGDRRIHAGGFLVTLFDTSVESPMNVMADEHMLEIVKSFGKQTGIITGQQLAQVFSWLRPNDLIWNYWVNNYLMGDDPPAFDVLAWNADSTRLTAQLQGEIIEIVKTNGLTKHGVLRALGTPIDLKKVTRDTFVVAAETDHIAAWEGCYAATQVFGGKVDFILSASGHIQSIVCPPDNPKARYLSNSTNPADPHAWRAGAQEHKGSWWQLYADWLAAHADGQVPPTRRLGSTSHPILAAAPGTYVRED